MRRMKSLPLLFRMTVLFLTAISILLPMKVLGENLLANGDFSQLESDGFPSDWYTEAYIQDAGYTLFSVQTDEEGKTAAEIRNLGYNDARFAQTVDVEPETLYRFSAEVLVENAVEGHGANLSVEGLYSFSTELFDTDGTWKTIEWYGETGTDQRSVTLFARLGGYSGLTKGRACFRNLRLEEVHAVPGDEIASKWFREEPSYDYGEEDWSDDLPTEETASPFWPWLIVIGLAYTAAGAFLIRFTRDGLSLKHNGIRGERWILALVTLFSLTLRLLLSARIEGYQVDVNCFLSWGQTMAAVGPSRFYQTTSFCDYPPLYLYILGLNSTASAGSSAEMTRIIFRLLPNLCDLAACWMIYEGAKARKTIPSGWALIISGMLSLNPAFILNSAAWGQMDSVFCLLLMITAVLAAEEKWLAALPLYILCVLLKPQALMVGPIGLVCFIQTLVHTPSGRRRCLAALVLSAVTAVICVLPFSVHQPAGWLLTLYQKTLSSYSYATLNTANFHYLLGGNWAALGKSPGIIPGLLLALAAVSYSIWWYRCFKEQKYYQAEAIFGVLFAVFWAGCTVFNAPWTWIGIGAMVFAFVIVLSMLIRDGSSRQIAYWGALLLILLYVFGLKMHERYILPALFLLGASWVRTRDRRILYLILGFSCTLFINEGIILDNSIRLGSSGGHLNADTVWLADILSVLNCIGALYAVHLGGALLRGTAPAEMAAREAEKDLSKNEEPVVWHQPDPHLHWNKKDSLILLAVTSAFALLSFTTLGSTKAPQHGWVSSDYDEQIIFDLGEAAGDTTMLYFGQVSRNDFSVAESEDLVHWSDEIWAEMEQSQCWKWKYLTIYSNNYDGTRSYYNSTDSNLIHLKGRYIRLSAQQIGLKLNEILFRNAQHEIIPAVVLSHDGGETESSLYSDPAALLDEQDTLENLPGLFSPSASEYPEPSWWNSTYFDEIYHARTAYEFIQGTVPYETSHPPLGKVLMSLSVLIFGMTPFGWRFAGALAGVLMLPGMYLLTKQLTKKNWAATLACALFALDCQHLTQTQIATIDSFPVLFILFAYFFMLRFLQTDYQEKDIRKQLIPLAFSGLFMGLAIASKWIGIYAGLGLAVLYFGYGIRMTARGMDHKRFIHLSLWCLLFFVAVPAVIYLLSYIPYMAYNKRITNLWEYIGAVWQAQTGMLNYHGSPGLGMDHPFYSPWWEWPIIGKPMYFASKQYIPAESSISYSIFCFGNPVIWYGALPALVICLGRWIYVRTGHPSITDPESRLITQRGNPVYGFLFIGLLAQYLPWVLVPRGTYIYHYFASVPFIILGIVLCLHDWPGIRQKQCAVISWMIAGMAAISFVIFLPYACGMAAPIQWLDLGKAILKIWY